MGFALFCAVLAVTLVAGCGDDERVDTGAHAPTVLTL